MAQSLTIDIQEGTVDIEGLSKKTFSKDSFSMVMDNYEKKISISLTDKITAPISIIPITNPFKSNSRILNFHFFIFGVGGTGGYVVRDLSRFIYALKKQGKDINVHITLIDGDKVEEKNVLRQNFINKDIGKNKASVLAERYSKAFGLEIQAVETMLTEDSLSKFRQMLSGDWNSSSIIIGCVDNNKARRLMKKLCETADNRYWIDCGNEKVSGQVVLGYGNKGYYYSATREMPFWLPSVIDLYPEIQIESMDETEDQISCAERTLVDTQNIFVNLSSAMHALNFIRQIVLNEKITVSTVEFNIKGLTKVRYITEDFLRGFYE